MHAGMEGGAGGVGGVGAVGTWRFRSHPSIIHLGRGLRGTARYCLSADAGL